MPAQPTKGTKQLNVEVAADVVEQFRAFAAARGESVSENVEVAMIRHMRNPPPLPQDAPLPPLPPAPPEPPAAKAPGTKKRARKPKGEQA